MSHAGCHILPVFVCYCVKSQIISSGLKVWRNVSYTSSSKIMVIIYMEKNNSSTILCSYNFSNLNPRRKIIFRKRYSYILHTTTFQFLVRMWVNYMSKYSNIYCIDWSKCDHNLPIQKVPSTLRHASQLWKLFACGNRTGNLTPVFKLFSQTSLWCSSH